MTDLPITYRGAVYPWQCDHVGPMNVMWYVGKFDEATWQYFATFGLTPSFLREQGRGMAAVQQNITYKRELRPGDVVTVRAVVKNPPATVAHDMSLREAAEIMVENSSEILPVLENGRFAGLVSWVDLFDAVLGDCGSA
jgi:acyl-CoA thioester hydrolase